MGEVQVSRGVGRSGIIALDDFANGYSHSRVVKGGGAVVDVGSIGGKRCCCKSSKKEDLKHLEKLTGAGSNTYRSSQKLEAKGKGREEKYICTRESSRTGELGQLCESPHRRARS